MTASIPPAPPVGASAAPSNDDRQDQRTPAAAPATAPAAAPGATDPDRLALAINRASNGTFFYSLIDPITGQTVVVIPNKPETSENSGYQAGEYLSVSV